MRRLDIDIGMHNVCEIHVERCTGLSGRNWLSLTFVDETGATKEMAVWPPEFTDPAPELVIDDKVAVRRVHAIRETADD